MPVVAMNPSSVQSTPSRDRTQAYRSDMSSSSPSTIRVTQSAGPTSSTGAPGPSTSNAPLTVQNLLSANASSQDPRLAALEFAVSDRNTLSSQNAQLWKLVERQRTGYAQLVKEIERVRGERDVYRTKLQLLGENTDVLLRAHREKEKREGKDSMRSASHAHLRNGESGGSSTSGTLALDPKANLPKATSDDIAFQRGFSSSQSMSNEPLGQSTSARPSGRERQGSQNSLNIPPSASQIYTANISASPASALNKVNVSSSHSTPESATSSSTHLPLSHPERSPDIRPPYAQSLSSVSSALENEPAEYQSSLASPPSTAKPLGSPYSGVAPLPSLQSQLEPQAGPSSEPDNQSTHPQVIVQSASLSNGTNGSEAELIAPQRVHRSVHGSPISLPEEAKKYYATMRESPVPSPLPTHEFIEMPTSRPLEMPTDPGYQQRAESSDKLSQRTYPERSESLPNPYDDEPPAQTQEDGAFLDLDEVDSASDSMNDSGRDSAVDSMEPDDYAGQQESAVATILGRADKKPAAVEDFPLPPTSPPIPPGFSQGPLQQQQVQALQHIRSEPTELQSQAQPPGIAVVKSAAELNGSISMADSQSELSHISSVSSSLPLIAGMAPQATFRALPLLSSDLPYTTIEVTNSSIRPNDRGKEVLSFIIAVNPGRGKEGWKVEKLYSDVLTLDSRVRTSVGKTLGKKLASLPEGRLWKDHAPAKVDQRKAALEYYLRSLISLPVKNKDEIVAFFTSDILRSAQKPVAQAGYKEGYLTKRGKNFGGWKTRYFVLQGPSLEYYESRGGTHLGSIIITGAQIGRQQRAADKKDADEDNEYRHAFLIIEAKRGPAGSNPRHVLCAESDEERDSWVEELVRYVSGTYNDEDFSVAQNGAVSQQSLGRVSTSSSDIPSTPTRRPRKEEIAKGVAVPISQLAPDASNAKLFQSAPVLSDDSSVTSPAKSAPVHSYVDQLVQEAPMSSSLPATSPLGVEDSDVLAPVGQRANSEMGHYPDLVDARSGVSKSRQGFASPEQRRRDKRKSINPLKSSPIPERSSSPEKETVLQTPRVDAHGKVKISGPMGGTLIPAGYKFGGKDAPAESASLSDRREKAKSRSFWGFGGAKHDKPNAPVHVPRAVFGVSLEESLEIAEIAGLPAIVFRCIQYLEVKKAEQEEGIYRLSGSSATIKALKDRFNNEGDVDLLGSDEYWDPHAIAGLLKTYLRDLPASILTRDLHLRFLSVIDFVDPQERVVELSQLIASLPTANYSLLRALTAHLILIVQNANVNKMTMRNVGIVFSPTLGIPAGVFSLMLGEFNRVFNVDGALDDGHAGPEGTAESVDISRRNSKHYSDAAADQLLGLSGRTLSAPAEDAQSDAEELSIHDESGTEGTDNAEIESIVESSAASSSAYLAQPDLTQGSEPDGNALSPNFRSKASNVAASRGLNISVTDKASRRHSRVVGLPHSPRPALSDSSSSPHTPQRAGSSSAPITPSPLHTPR